MSDIEKDKKLYEELLNRRTDLMLRKDIVWTKHIDVINKQLGLSPKDSEYQVRHVLTQRRFHNFANYEAPDGEECMQKTFFLGKFGFIFGFGREMFHQYSLPKAKMITSSSESYFAAIRDGCRCASPLVLFALTACTLTGYVGDRPLTYLIAGGLGGVVNGLIHQSPNRACFVGSVWAILAYCYKRYTLCEELQDLELKHGIDWYGLSWKHRVLHIKRDNDQPFFKHF